MNGNVKWLVTTLVGVLLCLLTFMGGRFSVSGAIEQNTSCNRVQDEQIATIKTVLTEQSAKMDKVYTLLMEMNQRAARDNTRRGE